MHSLTETCLIESDHPKESEKSIDDHSKVVECGRILDYISKSILAFFLGPDKTPVHVVVPDEAVECRNQLKG